MTAKVYVTLKKAVLAPQGKAVERSLAHRSGRFMGFSFSTVDRCLKDFIRPDAACQPRLR
jgi:hypothetical protein